MPSLLAPLARRRLLKSSTLALAAACLPAPLSAQAAEFSEGDFRYAVQAYGLTVGALRLQNLRRGDHFEGRIVARADGLAAILSGNTTSYSAIAARVGGVIRPVSFKSVQSKSDRQRLIDISYGSDGQITSFRYRNNGRDATSDVPRTAWTNTIDPVTASFRLRDTMAAGRGGATLPIFDGRKLYDTDVTDEGSTDIEIAGQKVTTRVAKLVFIAKAGFERGDGLITFPGETPTQYARIHFRPGDMAPILMTTVGDATQASASLQNDCLGKPQTGACANIER
ncbi:DUF3108 domain-containing protein [Arboricoccus pini]|nr:DUF3108 domain-containing protein [Arboricoccus pini]